MGDLIFGHAIFGLVEAWARAGQGLVYSGVQMRFYVYISFCVSTTTESMKTNNIPLTSPIRLPPEMQKIFLNFSKFVAFRAFLEKSVVLENGHGKHQMWATPIHYTFIFSESQ